MANKAKYYKCRVNADAQYIYVRNKHGRWSDRLSTEDKWHTFDIRIDLDIKKENLIEIDTENLPKNFKETE